jgi:hypothetical protein
MSFHPAIVDVMVEVIARGVGRIDERFVYAAEMFGSHGHGSCQEQGGEGQFHHFHTVLFRD